MRLLEAKIELRAGAGNESARALSAWAFPGDGRSVIVIREPGVYALVQDVAGARGKSGIRIEADGVHLWLGGFSLRGCVGSLDGVEVRCPEAAAVVRGGIIEGWGRHGVNARRSARCELLDLEMRENAQGNIAFAARTEIVNCGRSTGERSGATSWWRRIAG